MKVDKPTYKPYESYEITCELESMLIQLDVVNWEKQWGIDETEKYALKYKNLLED